MNISSRFNLGLTLIFCLIVNSVTLAQLSGLRNSIPAIINGRNADIGIGIKCIETGDTLYINGDKHYAMQSVFKFHLSLAILKQIEIGKFKLTDSIHIQKTDLHPDTWSPMRDKYPEGDVSLPISEIIRYTVSESDNNGCDLFFSLLGGPLKVEEFIKSQGIKEISIKANEAEMHTDRKIPFSNWTTPLATVSLLEKFYQRKILNDSLTEFIWKCMTESTTGLSRINGLLPEGSVVAHKSGSSGRAADGITDTCNDIGIMCLPNGQHLVVAVFVANSSEEDSVNENIIARIAKAAWDNFGKP